MLSNPVRELVQRVPSCRGRVRVRQQHHSNVCRTRVEHNKRLKRHCAKLSERLRPALGAKAHPMLMRLRTTGSNRSADSAGFIVPCQPTLADKVKSSASESEKRPGGYAAPPAGQFNTRC